MYEVVYVYTSIARREKYPTAGEFIYSI